MLISPAYAQAAGGAGGGDMLVTLMPLVLIFVVFYFLLIRPQQKKAKQHKEMLGSLKRGDRIVTGGGIVGKIVRIEGDNELMVEIAPDVRVRVRQGTVAELVVRISEPPAVKEDDAAADEADGKAGKKRRARR